MRFTKMQGLGNDYIYLDCTKERPENAHELARRISDRHFGVGSDGLICVCPSRSADFRMEMYNADGTQGEMCGNGIRCMGKYVYDRGMTNKTDLTIETPGGVRTLRLQVGKGQVVSALSLIHISSSLLLILLHIIKECRAFVKKKSGK